MLVRNQRFAPALLVLLVLGAAAALLAGPLAPPSGPTVGTDGVLNPFLAGQPAKAAEVNHNFKVLAEAVNDLADDVAAIAPDAYLQEVLREAAKTTGLSAGPTLTPALRWSAPVLGAPARYDVEVLQGASVVQALATTGQTTSFQVPAGVLTQGSSYSFRVRPVGATGAAGPWSAEKAFTATASSVSATGLTFLGLNTSTGLEEYRNDKDGSVLVYLPGGTFSMGTSDYGAVHDVTLSAFLIGKKEITWAQWKTYQQESGLTGGPSKQFNEPDTHPLIMVTYDEAKAYCAWAGGRLPTEAEWEYASRAGRTDAANGTVYGTSTGGISHDLANYAQSDGTTAGTADQFVNTSPVGTFPTNPFGLFDMSGNVWEWCSDWYEASYPAVAVTDPTGPAGPLQYRLLRGGSWNNGATALRSASRHRDSPAARNGRVGLRVARIPR